MLTAVAAPPANPTLWKAQVDAAFREALVASLDALELRDRNFVRFHYFHGLTVERLAGMLHVPQAAVVRQRQRIRERVLADTRRRLARRLPANTVDRLIDIARERLDLTIGCVLRS